MIAYLRRFVASLLMVSLALPVPGQAALVSTEMALDSDRARIVELLDRADVQAQLLAYGVSAAEVKSRVGALSDVEAAELAAKIDELPAGGIGIIGAIVLIFLVLLITDILGLTKVFPFTRPIKK